MYNLKIQSKMENLILLLLSVDSINLRSQNSTVVFSCDDYKQTFPIIETEIFYNEKFCLTFDFDGFRKLTCLYNYNIEIWKASISFLDVQPDNFRRDSSSFSGSLEISDADMKQIGILPDWSRFIQRIRYAHNNSLYAFLKDYVVDYMNINAHILKHKLETKNID